MSCELRKILKKGLCPKDLNKEIKILVRNIKAPKIGDYNIRNTYDLLGKFLCGIETISPIMRKFQVDVGNDITHLFYFMYSSRLEGFEVDKHFVDWRGKYYRFRGYMNHNEDNKFLILYFEERGDKLSPEAGA